MKLRYFTATAFSAVVAVSFLPKAVAGSNYKLIERNGKVYCIGQTNGTYYFAGTNVNGFGVDKKRAEYSSTVPNPENGIINGNVNKGEQTNKNHWSNEGQSVWGFDYYTEGKGNTDAKNISKDAQVDSLQFPTGIGGANRLRGFIGGKHQPNVLDEKVQAYTVENVAYSVSLNLCGYGTTNPEQNYSEEIPPLNQRGTPYTSKELLSGQVRPVFDGGTLLFDKNALYSDDNFIVNDFAGNTINNNNLNIELRGVLSGEGG